MSFTGATKRVNQWLSSRWAFWTAGLIMLPLWWSLIVCWYCIFGIFLVPYRMLRRHSREQKRQARQLDALIEATRER